MPRLLFFRGSVGDVMGCFGCVVLMQVVGRVTGVVDNIHRYNGVFFRRLVIFGVPRLLFFRGAVGDVMGCGGCVGFCLGYDKVLYCVKNPKVAVCFDFGVLILWSLRIFKGCSIICEQ